MGGDARPSTPGSDVLYQSHLFHVAKYQAQSLALAVVGEDRSLTACKRRPVTAITLAPPPEAGSAVNGWWSGLSQLFLN